MSVEDSQKLQGSLMAITVITADVELGDGFSFNGDPRFQPEVLLKGADPTIPIIERDQANFAMVELNSSQSFYYPVTMTRQDVDRTTYLSIIQKKRQISELINA